MRHPAAGFSVVHVLLVLVILGIIGGTGWWVYQAQIRTQAALDSAAAQTYATPKKQEAKPNGVQAPAGYLKYENKNLKFGFAYPEKWGALQKKDDASAILTLLSAQMPLIGASSKMTDKTEFKITVTPESDTFIATEHKGAIVRPSTSTSGLQWLVSNPGMNRSVMVGDSYTPDKDFYQTVKNGQGTTVYAFKLTHANATWWTLTFQSGDNFVTLTLPTLAPDMELPAGESAKLKTGYQADTDAIAKSVTIL